MLRRAGVAGMMVRRIVHALSPLGKAIRFSQRLTTTFCAAASQRINASAARMPAKSTTRSRTSGVRPGTKAWCNSSITANSAAPKNAAASVVCARKSVVLRSASQRNAARAANSLKCATQASMSRNCELTVTSSSDCADSVQISAIQAMGSSHQSHVRRRTAAASCGVEVSVIVLLSHHLQRFSGPCNHSAGRVAICGKSTYMK